jgi:hypothetical protein
MNLKLVAIFAVAIAVTGCASVGNNFDENRAANIEKGVTTESDLIRMFGEPNNRTVNGNGTKVLDWTYVQSEVKGESFIPYAGSFLGGTNSAQKSMHVVLNAAGRVADYTVSSGGTEYRENQLGAPGGSEH